MTTEPRQVGAFTLDASRTRFTVWAPLQPEVRLRFPASGREEPLIATPDGFHSIETDAPPGTLYQYALSQGRVRPDPASLGQPHGVHGPSLVMARASAKPATLFSNPPLRHHVLYELHVGTFTPEGTFDAIIPRLAALRELGVTAIELMPVAQCPGERNWGYDGVGLFSAQWSYGGLPGLLRLVDACHQHGLAIVLDVVYNHIGPEGNYLADFGPYFTNRYKTPWGAALNFDGPESDQVREFFIQNSLFWTRDCGIDGLRLDAVHAIVDHTASTFIEELTARNHAAAEARGRRVLIIAESGDNDPRLVRPRQTGGLGLDGCWNDDYHHAVRAAITGERRGYYRPFGEPKLIAKAIHDRYVFSGEYSSSHKRRHGAPARDLDHGQFIVFTQNHDQVGNRPAGDRLDRSADWDGSRAAAALVLLSPFTPMLWMGEEYAEPAPFLYFVHHSDPELIKAVREGRAAEFAEFQLPGGVPDAQDDRTFLRSKLAWNLRASGRHAGMLAFYTELLCLRRKLDVPGRAGSTRSHAVGPVVSIEYGPQPTALVVANTSNTEYSTLLSELSSPESTAFSVLLDSHDPRWESAESKSPTPTQNPTRIPADQPLRLAPRSALVLQSTRETP